MSVGEVNFSFLLIFFIQSFSFNQKLDLFFGFLQQLCWYFLYIFREADWRIDYPQKIWTHLSFCERFRVNFQTLFEVLVITDDPALASAPWLAPSWTPMMYSDINWCFWMRDASPCLPLHGSDCRLGCVSKSRPGWMLWITTHFIDWCGLFRVQPSG